MTKTNTLNFINIDKYAIHILYACFGLMVMGILSYLFFINQTVFHVVERQHIVDDINQLESEVAGLEASYLALSASEVTLEHAYSLGFKDVSSEQSYAVKSSKTVGLSLTHNDI